MNQKILIWLGVNLAGIGIYLLLASSLWVLPGEQGLPGGPGDAFFWILTLVPIQVIFAVLNLVALVKAIQSWRRTKDYIRIILWLLVISLWANALLYDHVRVFRFIC